MRKILARRWVMFAALVLVTVSYYAGSVEVPRAARAAAPLQATGSDLASDQPPAVVAQAETTKIVSREELLGAPPGAALCAAENPKVTIVFWGGPQCATTSKYFLEVIDPLAKQYPGKVGFVMGQLPMTRSHPDAEAAARLMLVARQHRKLCQMIHAEFQLFKSVGGVGVLTPERRRALATKIDLDPATLEAEASSDAVTRALQAERDYAKSINVNASPTIFVNGRRLQTFSEDALRSMVQEELKK